MIELVSYSLTLFYIALIFYFYFGWIQIIRKASIENYTWEDKHYETLYSIIISARNEEKNIVKCLEDLINQNVPTQIFEIIVLNDSSTDNTENLINDFIKHHPAFNIKCLNMYNYKDVKNKKDCITIGIAHAQSNCIILSDADCKRSENWLNAIHFNKKESNSVFLSAPVLFEDGHWLLSIQALEYAGLMGIGAAAIERKAPNMCSAANLIFDKEVFDEVGGYIDNRHIASGDDEYLLHKIFKKYPDKVQFLCSKDALVYSQAHSGMQELAMQRKRWVSKSTQYSERYITVILILAYLFNASIVYNLICNYDASYTWICLTLKILVEYLFLRKVLIKFNKVNLLNYLPIAEIIHIPYVLFIGVWAQFGSYTWKDRKQY